MATAWKELVKGTPLTGAPANLYTAPAGTSATIQAASVTNGLASVVIVAFYIVPVGQSVGAAYRVASRSVPASGVAQFYELINHKLEPGASIYAEGNGTYVTISGAEYVPNT